MDKDNIKVTGEIFNKAEKMFAEIPHEWNSISCDSNGNTIFYDIIGGLAYNISFDEGDHLTITVAKHGEGNSKGKRLAILSDLYEAFNKEFGEPSFFYSVKDDDRFGIERYDYSKDGYIEVVGHGFEETYNLHWSFKDEIRDINEVIDKPNVEDFIMIHNPDKNAFIDAVMTHRTGLPSELSDLVEENHEEYVKYKKFDKKRS